MLQNRSTVLAQLKKRHFNSVSTNFMEKFYSNVKKNVLVVKCYHKRGRLESIFNLLSLICNLMTIYLPILTPSHR